MLSAGITGCDIQQMTLILYVRVGSNYLGLRLPGWGVAVVAGAVFTLAPAVLSFYAGGFAASLTYKNENQRLAEQDLEQLKAEAELARTLDASRLHAATGKLGELYARMIALDRKGKSIAEAAGLELPDPQKEELVADIAVQTGAGSAAAN